jgi:hypothetical protein
MRKELFLPYKEMILRCIESCESADQLTVCGDMMDRFNEQFMYCADPKERALALDELSAAFLQKQHEVNP